MTEVLTGGRGLKAGWKTVKFGDVVKNANLTERDPETSGIERIVGLEHLDPENLHIRRWNTLENGTSFSRKFVPGQTLFGKRRAYQRKVAFAEFEGICSGDILTFEPKDPNVLLPELLPFICQTDAFFDHALGTSAGSLSPRTSYKALQNFEFPLPPIEEQRRIAEILWAADEAVETKIRLKSMLSTTRKVMIKHLFSYGVRTEKLKSTRIGPLPRSWKVKNLNQVVDFLDGRRVPLKQNDRAKRRGPYPYYGASGIIDHVDNFIFDEPLILLSEDGFNLVHRNSPIAFKVQGKCWVNNHAHVLRPKQSVHIDVLREYLESISYEPYITGTYQRKINKSVCETIPVPVPPTDQQNEINAVLLSFDRQVGNTQTAIDASEELIGMLLSELLSVVTRV